jgi:hypothetical protein
MPQNYRRGAVRPGRNVRKTSGYYRPQKRQSKLEALTERIKKLPRRFLILTGSCLLLLVLLISMITLFNDKAGTAPTGSGSKARTPVPTATAIDPTVTLPPRAAALLIPEVTPEAVPVRDLSFGAKDVHFKERQINQPALFGNELFYSAGTGDINSGHVFTKMFLYNLDTGEEEQVSAPMITKGEYYETQLNKDWLVWVLTDGGIHSQIYMKNRHSDNAPFRLRECTHGKPKLRLAGDTLIWMEPVNDTSDQLMMTNLNEQEVILLDSFSQFATYGVSAPCIFDEPVEPGGTIVPGSEESPTASPTPTPSPTPAVSETSSEEGEENDSDANPDETNNTTVVWAGPDSSQTPEQAQAEGEHSAIFWVKLGEGVSYDQENKIRKNAYLPGTYVHEPLYNGTYFAWVDGNYAPRQSLYIGKPNETPIKIDDSVTTYSLGDDILVYGKGMQIWVYIISTGEYCRLTSGKEEGKTPLASGNAVVWSVWTTDLTGDVMRYKLLTDRDLGAGGE